MEHMQGSLKLSTFGPNVSLLLDGSLFGISLIFHLHLSVLIGPSDQFALRSFVLSLNFSPSSVKLRHGKGISPKIFQHSYAAPPGAIFFPLTLFHSTNKLHKKAMEVTAIGRIKADVTPVLYARSVPGNCSGVTTSLM